MSFRAVAASACLLSAALVAGCTGLTKTENPLSPTVAGPIPGVNIGQPIPLDPKDGRTIDVANQPITLVLANAQTNGVRPLSYTFEVATDTGFSTKVFVREGVTPGANGQTSLRLADPLGTGRTYYWRARALDGANTGPYSGFAHFSIFTPIVIEKPSPDEPINNVLVDSDVPTFVFGNAPRSGPVGPFFYTIEVADGDSFTNRYAIWTVGEQANVTHFTAPSALPGGKQYFWHVRASDGGNTGPWSDTHAFRTPTPPAPPTTGGGGGVGTSGHIGPGPTTVDRVRQVVFGTATEFPRLTSPRNSDAESEAAGTELMLRMIWHMKLVGFDAGRQRNPSGTISPDKLTVFADGGWRTYDVFSSRPAGVPLDVHFDDVCRADATCPNRIVDPGIPD
jgi:hypothetical protein